jgi:hypothetical protein
MLNDEEIAGLSMKHVWIAEMHIRIIVSGKIKRN